MRAVVQRVKNCSVSVDGNILGQIAEGLLIYLGVNKDDDEEDLDYILNKTVHLRIFPDIEGKMNLSVIDSGSALMVISQFTLLGDVRRGRRPSYSNAAEPQKAIDLYKKFINSLKDMGLKTESGEFGAMMDVAYTNCGPVTILLDSKKLF